MACWDRFVYKKPIHNVFGRRYKIRNLELQSNWSTFPLCMYLILLWFVIENEVRKENDEEFPYHQRSLEARVYDAKQNCVWGAFDNWYLIVDSKIRLSNLTNWQSTNSSTDFKHPGNNSLTKGHRHHRR